MRIDHIKDYFNNQEHAYNREKERIAQGFIQRVEQRLVPWRRVYTGHDGRARNSKTVLTDFIG